MKGLDDPTRGGISSNIDQRGGDHTTLDAGNNSVINA
jgi:hypothetical protein